MFVLSKLFALIAAPLNLVLIALVVLTVLGFTRWRRWQRPLLTALAAMLVVVAMLPWDAVMIRPLEDRFPQTPLPQRVDGIVVLGGALDPVMTRARGQVAAGSAVERLTALVRLARLYPEARLVFTGGSGSITVPELKEAPVARRFLEELGFDAGRVMFEEQSRNTRENALFTKDLIKPAAGETWLLVTSALHMPRSIGAFTAAGWSVTPHPVDYLSRGGEIGLAFNLSGALGRLNVGLHEWLGLFYYRLRGWSDRLFPGP